MGLNKGFMLMLHAETRLGQATIFDGAALSPSNTNMLMPSLGNTTAITGVQVLQALSEEWAVTFGKINALDLFNTIYPQTGRGVDGFMNTGLLIPLTVGSTIPLSFNGAGVLKLNKGRIQGGLLVYDSNSTPTTVGFNDMFDNGANIAGMWRVFSNFGGLPGSHMALGTYADGTYSSLDPNGWGFVPGAGLVVPDSSGSWSLNYILEQQLWVDNCNPDRSIGLLGQWGIADKETSPWEWVMNVAVTGKGLIKGRSQDTVGVGYFYQGLSSDLKSLPSAGLGDVQGGEIYYNAELTPWCHLTTDLQVVEPALRRNDTAVVLGLRLSVDL